MKWTFDEYLIQPDWFINSLVGKWKIDSETKNKKDKQNENCKEYTIKSEE